MSIGSKLIQGGVTLVAIISVGMTFNDMSHSRNLYQSKVSLLKDLKSEYSQDQKKKPTIKHVTTVYQEAMKVAKQYLALQNKLHDLGDVPYVKQKPLINKLKQHTTGSLVPSGSLVQPEVKNWHAVVDYGGETTNDRVVMAYRWFDQDNKLMRIDTFYYNADSHKLSGFSYYLTKDGVREVRDQVRGWKD